MRVFAHLLGAALSLVPPALPRRPSSLHGDNFLLEEAAREAGNVAGFAGSVAGLLGQGLFAAGKAAAPVVGSAAKGAYDVVAPIASEQAQKAYEYAAPIATEQAQRAAGAVYIHMWVI